MICGYKDLSLIDYPGLLAPVVFLGGCNFRCPFCYNRHLALEPEKMAHHTTEAILDRIKDARPLAGGVVITGGEPTLWGGLEDFILQLRSIEMKVKLDTNGSLPDVLEKLISKNLLDYIAMDIKSPLEHYNKAAGVEVNTGRILKSIELIKSSGLNHEFRTTCVPGCIDESAIQSICSLLGKGERYSLQNFKPINTINPDYMLVQPFPAEEMERFRQACAAAGLAAKVI